MLLFLQPLIAPTMNKTRMNPENFGMCELLALALHHERARCTKIAFLNHLMAEIWC